MEACELDEFYSYSGVFIDQCLRSTLSLSPVMNHHPGLDDLLAQHIAHLFIRDPISLFAEKLDQSVENETDHFEVGGSDRLALSWSCTCIEAAYRP